MTERLGIAPLALLAIGAKVAIPAGAGAYVYNLVVRDKSKLPVSTIYKAMSFSWYGKPPINQTTIKNWWDVYVKGVMEKGLDAFDRNGKKQPQPILKYMQNELKLPTFAYILDFLTTLQILATKGNIDRKYWDPASSMEATKAVQDWKSKQVEIKKPPIIKTGEKIADSVKWVSIAAVAGIGLYFAQPFFKKLNRK